VNWLFDPLPEWGRALISITWFRSVVLIAWVLAFGDAFRRGLTAKAEGF
jgi:hypothetical protein